LTPNLSFIHYHFVLSGNADSVPAAQNPDLTICFLFAKMDHRYGAHWHPYPLHPPLSPSQYHSPLHRHVTDLLRCPDKPSPSNIPSPSLAYSIAYAFHHAQLTSSVTFATLRLLQRLGMQFIHHLFISAFMFASNVICNDTDSGSYPAQCTLPAPSSGPFAHPKPSTNNILTAIPSFGPGTPPSPPSTTSSVPTNKSSRRSSAVPESQLPTPPSSHSNVPSPVDSMSPATPPNYEGDTAKIVSSAGSNLMQISGDNISPPYHHHHTRKSSSPIPAHPKSQTQTLDTKHTSPKKTSSAHQHAAKPNTVYAFARPCTW